MALAQEAIYQRQDIYEPLDNRSRDIRVISLHPGLYSEPLECDLIRTSLANPPSNEKLSYTWGDPKLVSQILVNGHELSIHGNLDIALRRLRLKDAPRILWTDAICINQASTSERSSQVAMMSQVYESTGAVLVWLGPSSDDSHLAVDLLAEMRLNKFDVDYILESVRNHDNLPRWKALFALCRREYWNRIWTAQEIVCDKEALLICGQDSMAFTDLAQVVWLLQGLHYGEAVSVPEIVEAGLDRLRIPSNYWAMQISHRTENEPDLLTLMTTFRAHRCSDPRDKVYGMASMARDVRDSTFRVDYDLSTGQVYLQAARWTIGSTKKLNVLCCRFGQDPAMDLPLQRRGILLPDTL
jgi:Heterokaryon incompatibility protein (HET)